MGRHTPSAAERGFLDAMLETRPLVKRAVDLDPGVADILGVQSVSPSILKGLESGAGAPAPAAAEPVQDEAAPEQASDEPPPAEIPDGSGADLEPPPAEDAPVEPPLPSRLTHGKLFADKHAHPMQIFEVLTMRYQEDWVEWEPETLWWALRRDFGPVGEVSRNKIMALRLAAVTDMPWLDWDTFENCSLAWSGTIPIFGAYQPVTPSQAAFGVQILREIRGDENFAWEVKAYIAAILEDSGFVYAPEEWYAGAQDVIDRKVWLLGFKTEVAAAWAKVSGVDPSQIDWDETSPLQVHLLKLAVVKQVLDQRTVARAKIPGGRGSAAAVSPSVPA